MFVKNKVFDDIFYVEDGQHPLLLKQFLAKKVSLETMCILEELLNYCKYWNDDINEKYVWKERKTNQRLSGVLTFDKDLYKIITMSNNKGVFLMESEILSVMKERDFYRAKVDELKQSIRKLEYDNAELVKSNEEFSQR